MFTSGVNVLMTSGQQSVGSRPTNVYYAPKTVLLRNFDHIKEKQLVKVIWHKAASPPQTEDSVVFARLRKCALPWGHVTLAPPGEYDWTCASFGPAESTTHTANRSVQPFLHSLRKSVVGHALPLIIAPSHRDLAPSNACFLGHIRVQNPNGFSIGSAVFAGLTSLTDRQTDHAIRSATIDRIYLRIVLYTMRSKTEVTLTIDV